LLYRILQTSSPTPVLPPVTMHTCLRDKVKKNTRAGGNGLGRDSAM
jgi:hypothetical protein